MYKILVVDDDELMRISMTKIISSVDGFQVDYIAKNGREAVEICKNNQVDIIFMDIMMPVMNGIDATREILSINPKANIYIVSSYQSFEMAKSAINSKIKRYFVKPVNPEIIVEILNNHREDKGNKENSLAKRIFDTINEKDFMKAYEIIDELVDEIYEIRKEADLRTVLKEISDKVFISVFHERDYDFEEIKNKFSISDKAVLDKRMLSIWIFKIMDYIFAEISSSKYAILKNVFKYIDDKIGEDISLKDIVKDCNISQGYLSRIFKKELNMTIMNYIHLKKINLAKEYLCMTEKSGAEISFEVGYNEFSYFCKVFKKYEGMTISEYRNV